MAFNLKDLYDGIRAQMSVRDGGNTFGDFVNRPQPTRQAYDPQLFRTINVQAQRAQPATAAGVPELPDSPRLRYNNPGLQVRPSRSQPNRRYYEDETTPSQATQPASYNNGQVTLHDRLLQALQNQRLY